MGNRRQIPHAARPRGTPEEEARYAAEQRQQRVQAEEARRQYELQQVEKPLTPKERAAQAETRAVAVQKAALVAEIRRQRAVGEALDLQAALDAARGGPLVLPAMIAQGDLGRVSMAEWLQNVRVLSDLALHAPDPELRMEAADRAAGRTHAMLELIANKQAGGYGQGPNRYVESPITQPQGDTGLTREEKIALVRRQLRLAENV